MRENVTMLHGWRTGSNHVLIEYHNRPAFFVNHMRYATIKSLEITQDMIETISLETGEFKVRYSILIFCQHTTFLQSHYCK